MSDLDIDYIRDIQTYILELSYHVRKRNKLNKTVVEEMINLTISLLNILELYIEEKEEY